MHALAGMAGLVALAWALSENRRAIPWRAVVVGLGLLVRLAHRTSNADQNAGQWLSTLRVDVTLQRYRFSLGRQSRGPGQSQHNQRADVVKEIV